MNKKMYKVILLMQKDSYEFEQNCGKLPEKEPQKNVAKPPQKDKNQYFS